MSKKNQHFVILGILYFLLISCSKDEEVIPLPEALFELNAEYSEQQKIYLAEKIDEISFINQSTNEELLEWNFGDGAISTENNPKHQYSKDGRYQVSLTVKNTNGEISTKEETVVIGSRIFSSLELARIDEKNTDDNSWDIDSGPDIFLFFGEVDNPDNSYILSFPDDLNNSELPFGGDIDLINLFVNLTDKDWFWILIDNDDPLSEFDNEDEYMFGTTINPTSIGSRALVDGKGKFELGTGIDGLGNSTSKYSLSIGWVLRVDN